MNVKCIALGELGANCYLLQTDKAAVVIDPGAYSDEVGQFLEQNRDKQRAILLTHGHFDHIGGAAALRESTDTPIIIGEADAVALEDGYLNLSMPFGMPMEPFCADRTVSDGEKLCIGDIGFTVFVCAGHTVGSVCYYTEDMLFCGDVLFCGSVGRTDFPGGDTMALLRSIARLMKLDGNTRVLSGHGAETTLLHEKNNNPFIRGRI